MARTIHMGLNRFWAGLSVGWPAAACKEVALDRHKVVMNASLQQLLFGSSFCQVFGIEKTSPACPSSWLPPKIDRSIVDLL